MSAGDSRVGVGVVVGTVMWFLAVGLCGLLMASGSVGGAMCAGILFAGPLGYLCGRTDGSGGKE